MAAPRYRIRSLLLLVVFSSLVLGIVSLTFENHRLRSEMALQQQRANAERRVAEAERQRAEVAVLQAMAEAALRTTEAQARAGK